MMMVFTIDGVAVHMTHEDRLYDRSCIRGAEKQIFARDVLDFLSFLFADCSRLQKL